MNDQEFLDALNEANAKLDKIITEVMERDAVQESNIAALELALANEKALNPEIQAAIDLLKANLKRGDEINEDAPVTDQATDQSTSDAPPPPPPVKDGVTSQSEEIV